MAVELRHLRYFVTVVEFGTVTAAAEHLRVAQPAISRQIQGLERELGVQLFRRAGPRLALSDAGRHMVPVANDILTRADRALSVAQEMAGGKLGRLTCAAASTTLDYVVSPFVATLGSADPFISVDSVAGHVVHQAVMTSHDIGISAASPPAVNLAWRHLTAVPLRAYVAQEHPWSTRATVPIDELTTAPLILPEETDPTRRTLDNAVIDAALSYARHEDVPWPRLRQALAAANRGVAIATDLPRFGAKSVRVVTADGTPVELYIHACWNPDHYAANALHDFVERLASFAQDVVRAEAQEV